MSNELSFFNNDFDLFDPFKDDFFEPGRFPGNKEILKCDVVENEHDYELIMDVPGLTKKDVTIEHEDGYLTITVSRNRNSEQNKKHFVRKERSFFTAKRSFYVGDIDESKLDAKLENGELFITIPKEERKVVKRTIEIK